MSSEHRSAGVELSVDATVALLDLEEAGHAPWGAPWVGAEPVVKASLSAPAEHLDGVTASNTTRDVVVNTALVVEEVVVDGEGSLHGSVVVELILDALNGGGVNGGAALALVLQPALAWTSAGWSADAGVTATGGVGPASVRDDTSVGEVLPDVVEVTTVATVVVGVARDGILRGEDEVLAGNAESVGESLGSTESPAWTALLLITDGVDALRELVSSGVEWGGGSTEGLVDIGGGNLRLEIDVGGDEVKELLSGVVSEGVSLRSVGFPTLGLSLDLINQLLVDGVGLAADHGGQGTDGTDNNELEHMFFNKIFINLSILFNFLIN